MPNETRSPSDGTYSNQDETLLKENLPFDLGGMEFTPLERFVLISYVVVLITFSIVPNTFVIFAVNKHKPLKIIPNYFLVSLSCTDILMATLVMPLALQYNLDGVWRHGVLACKFWAFGSYFCCASSIFHLCAIAIDRYRAITDPLEYGSKRTWSHLLMTLGFVWGLSFVGTSPPYFGWGITWPDHYDGTIPCTVPQSTAYAIYSSLICFYVPMTIIVGIYINIFFIGRNRSRQKIRRAFELVEINQLSSAKRHDTSQEHQEVEPHSKDPASTCEKINDTSKDETIKSGTPQGTGTILGKKRITHHIDGSKNRRQILPLELISGSTVPCSRCSGLIPKRQGKLCKSCAAPNNLMTVAENSRLTILIQRERRSALIMAIIILTFITCWLPAFTLYLVLALLPHYQQFINPKLITMVWWMTYSNSACNPIIYTIFNKDFKDAFNKFIRRK